MILFGLCTSQRLGDIAALTWQTIDLLSQEIRLTTGKTGRRQILPLVGPLLKFVKKLPASTNPATPYSLTPTESGGGKAARGT